jgi:hypothetical protein
VVLVPVLEPFFQDADLTMTRRPADLHALPGLRSSAAYTMMIHQSSGSMTLSLSEEDLTIGERPQSAFEAATRGLRVVRSRNRMNDRTNDARRI